MAPEDPYSSCRRHIGSAPSGASPAANPPMTPAFRTALRRERPATAIDHTANAVVIRRVIRTAQQWEAGPFCSGLISLPTGIGLELTDNALSDGKRGNHCRRRRSPEGFRDIRDHLRHVDRPAMSAAVPAGHGLVRVPGHRSERLVGSRRTHAGRTPRPTLRLLDRRALAEADRGAVRRR